MQHPEENTVHDADGLCGGCHSGSSLADADKGQQLIAAAEAGDVTAVRAQLDRPQPPDLEGRNSYGQKALMCAALNGQREAVALLLDKGADMEAQDSTWGQTALLWAAGFSRREVVALLLERGADASVRSAIGRTAEENASNEEVKALLRVSEVATTGRGRAGVSGPGK
jgi:ankyrin repeat protein